MSSDPRIILQEAGLRATGTRLAVYEALDAAQQPMSHKDAVELLPSFDRVSVFRSLGALTEAGLVRRLELGDHTFRFELIRATSEHQHAHFTCTACGDVTCLDDVAITINGPPNARLERLVREAEVQLRGVCGDCHPADAEARQVDASR